MIAYIFRLPDGHRLLPHRNLTSPHSDGKAFSLPATAYGNLPLQRSDFDQTQVSRHLHLIQQSQPQPACGMSLIARSVREEIFPETEVMAGLSLSTFTIRIRFSFYSVVKEQKAYGNLGPL